MQKRSFSATALSVFRFFGIIIGAFLYALGAACFFSPNGMVSGGVGGLSLILDRLTGVSAGAWVLLFNVPLLFFAFRVFGRRFFLATLLGVGAVSVFLNLLMPLGALTRDPLLAAFSGGALTALGLGTVFRCRATTGGTDILARLVKRSYPHIKTGVLLLLLDGLVIVLNIAVFRALDAGLYSALGVLIEAYLFDAVLYGTDSAKLVFLITEKPRELSRALLDRIGVGVTFVRAEGAYTGEERTLLLCAMHKKALPQARELVRSADPGAFLIVSPATQIFGEGFISHDREDL